MPKSERLPVVSTTMEQEPVVESTITQGVARVLYLDKFLERKPVGRADITEAATMSATDLNFDQLAQVSRKSVLDYYEKRQKLEGRSKHRLQYLAETEMGIINWIDAGNNKPENDAQRRERDIVFGVLGIEADPQVLADYEGNRFTQRFVYEEEGKEIKGGVLLFRNLEGFRKKYLEKRDIENFITDIAESSRPSPGQPVDTALFRRRLQSVRPLLNCFGAKEDTWFHSLASDFGMTYGLLSQNDPEKKQLLAETAAQAVQQDIWNRQEQQAFVQLRRVEKKENDLRQLVDDAKRDAFGNRFTVKKADEMREREDGIIHEFLTNPHETSQKFQEKLSGIKETRFAAIEVPTIWEFQRALELLHVSPEEVTRIVNHEEAHFREAIRQGCPYARYKIQLAPNSEGGFDVYPYTVYWLAKDKSDAEKRMIMKNVITAPPDMSIHDRNQVNGMSLQKTA